MPSCCNNYVKFRSYIKLIHISLGCSRERKQKCLRLINLHRVRGCFEYVEGKLEICYLYRLMKFNWHPIGHRTHRVFTPIPSYRLFTHTHTHTHTHTYTTCFWPSLARHSQTLSPLAYKAHQLRKYFVPQPKTVDRRSPIGWAIASKCHP